MQREIEHFAYVAVGDSPALVSALEAGGYEVEMQESEGTAGLRITHVSEVSPETTKTFITEIVTIVLEHGGEYDGWGASVIKMPFLSRLRARRS